MKTNTTLFATLASAALSLFSSIATAAAPPAEAFARLPAVRDVALSPNGKTIAWGADDGGLHVIIHDLETKKNLRLPIENNTKLRDLEWADDDMLLVVASQTEKLRDADVDRYRSEYFRTFAVDIRARKMNVLLMNDGGRAFVSGSLVEALRTPKPKTIVMSTLDYSAVAANRDTGTRLAGKRADSGWIAQLFEVDLNTGKGKSIEAGTQFTEQWVVDKDGRCVARSEWIPNSKSYQILAKRGMGWKQIYARKDGATLTLYGVSADGKSIVAIGPNEDGRRVLYSVALDGSGDTIAFVDPANDVDQVIRDPYTRAPLAVQLGGLKQDVHWLDTEAQKSFELASRPFKDRRVELSGRTLDGNRLLFNVSAPSHAPTYYLVDLAARTADMVGEQYPELSGVALGEVRAITYNARDTSKIPAYLTLPAGVEARNLPMVVLPHGGPEAHDDYDFDWWAQFLASRGYAVLQPQFRGSSGFGDKYRRAGYGQWGALMQDDVTDGVKAMIEQQIADPKRICIVGASYGGYAALAGAAFTPDLYKCAVSISGVSDLPNILGATKDRGGSESDSLAYWRDSIGSPTDKSVVEHSPARAADKIKVPVLLIHGLDDTVVPIAQSELMANALSNAKKKYEFVKIKGADHWMSSVETRQQIMQELERFLAENL